MLFGRSNGITGKRWELSKGLLASLRCCAGDGSTPQHRLFFASIWGQCPQDAPIKQLTHAEQSRVIHFALELARERQVSGDQLSKLARQMADSAKPAEVQRLRKEIHRGFYGE